MRHDARMTTQTTVASLTRIAQGREAEIFAWEPGTVLKLYRAGYPAAQSQHEAMAMAAAKAAGGPAPASLGATEMEGRTGLIIERVDGTDLLTRLGKNPALLATAGSKLAKVQAELHAIEAPAELPSLRESSVRRINGRRDLVPDDVAEGALAALDALPERNRLLHGDYHPGNVIITSAGPRVIDWPNATRGDPAADVARTLLMFRLGELPPGSPLLIRTVQGIGRKVLVAGYRRTYFREAPAVTDADVMRWMLPVAAVRLTEDIAEERERLLAYIETLPRART